MPDVFSEFSQWFWTKEFWLAENITWNDVERMNNFPPATDLFYCFPIALSYLLIQYLLQRLFFIPIAKFHGIKVKEIKPLANERLEDVFRMKRKSPTDYKMIKKLADELQWADRQVERWFRQRERMHKAGKFKKFKESGWRMIFYGSLCVYGIVCLWDKPWTWNLENCWNEYLTFKMPNEIWWYYMLEISFYVYLTVSQFTDVIRKDFWQMMIHHITTVFLLAMSFLMNCVRFGSLIMLCHDVADVPLECGKLTKYLKKTTICNICFVLFLLFWFPSRLWIFPFILIKSSVNDSHLATGKLRYVANAFLMILAVLHVIWTWMICKVVHRALFQGKLDDVRSDSDDCSSDSTQKKSM